MLKLKYRWLFNKKVNNVDVNYKRCSLVSSLQGFRFAHKCCNPATKQNTLFLISWLRFQKQETIRSIVSMEAHCRIIFIFKKSQFKTICVECDGHYHTSSLFVCFSTSINMKWSKLFQKWSRSPKVVLNKKKITYIF